MLRQGVVHHAMYIALSSLLVGDYFCAARHERRLASAGHGGEQKQGSFSFPGLDTPGALEAMNRVVEDTTQCKFEATNPSSDEVVLFNILQVCLRV